MEPALNTLLINEGASLFEQVFVANPLPMWIYDLQTLAFLAVNNAAIAHYGYGRDEFLCMTIKDIRPSEDVARLLDNIAQVTQGLDEAGVWRHVKKDGTLIEVEITSHTLSFKDRPAEMVLALDVTAKNHSIKALQESECRYRTLADSGQALIWTSGLDNRRDYFNLPWLLFTGRDLEQELADGWLAGVHVDDASRCHGQAAAAFAARQPLSMEYRLWHQSGAYRWIQEERTPRYDSAGNFLGYIGHCLDIDDRKREGEQLVAAHRQLKALWNISALIDADLETLSTTAMAIITELTGSELGFLAVVGEDVFCPFTQAWTAQIHQTMLEKKPWQSVPWDQCPVLSRVLQQKVPVVIEASTDGQAVAELWPGYTATPTTVLLVPLVVRHRVVLLVGVGGREAAYSSEDAEKIQSIASNIYPLYAKIASGIEQKKSERLLRNLVRNLGEGVILQDADENILLINQMVEQVFDVTANGVQGIHSTSHEWHTVREDGSLFPAKEHPSITTLRTGKPCTGVIMGIVSPQRGTKWIKVNTKPLCAERETRPYAVIISFSDITEEKRIVEELARKDALLSAMIRNLPFDFWARDAEQRLIMQSDQSVRFWGDLSGSTPQQSQVDEKTMALWEANNRSALAGEIVSSDCTFIGSNGIAREFHGSVAPIRDGVKILGILGINIDITNLKKTAEESESNRRVLQLFIEYAPAAIAMFDRDMRYLSYSRRWRTDFSLQEQCLLGKSHYEVVPNLNTSLVEQYTRCMAGEIIKHEEMSFFRSDGRTQWLRCEMHPWYNANNAIGGLIIFAEDITQRKQLENIKHENEQRLNFVLEGSQLGFWDWNIETGEVIRNERWAEMLGYTLEEVQCSVKQWSDLQHPDDQAMAWQAITDHLQGRTDAYKLEYRMRTKEGQYRWILDQAKIVRRDSEGKALRMSGTHTDVTERKITEERIRRSESLLRALVQTIPDLIWLKNTEGQYLSCNQTFERYIGVQQEEITGKNDYDFFDTQQAEVSQAEDDKVINNRSICRNQTWVSRGDRSKQVLLETLKAPMIDESGELIGVLGIGRDITARWQAEAERERMLLAIEQSGETVVITDVQGNIQYVNKAFEVATGFSREEAIGQNPRILQSGKHDEAFYHQLWATISSGHVYEGQMINKRKDGTLYTEAATISPVFDASGEIINYVAVKRDITEHIQLQKQLLQSQKMESVGRLAGGVAHDFNNMLSVIIGYAELALNTLKPIDPLYHDLEEIFKAGKRSAEITRQLLAFARKQAIEPKVLSLNDTVEAMLKMLRRLIGEDITLAWLPKTNLGLVKIDPSQVDQLLANLCVNARDAIEGVGTITIETRDVILDESYCQHHEGATPGAYVLLKVSDNGCGIDADTLSKIFEPFFTTKEEGKGTGLGLSTVYGIVKQNNGFIDVDSAVGAGTIFYVYLPKCMIQGARDTGVDVQRVRASHGEVILIVEDEVAVLSLSSTMLDRLGYVVLEASSGREALRLAAAYTKHIDLLISDVIMPEINGRDLAMQLCQLHPEMKILFMSGYTADVIAHQGVLEEGTCYIQKPFFSKEFAEKVREALGSNADGSKGNVL